MPLSGLLEERGSSGTVGAVPPHPRSSGYAYRRGYPSGTRSTGERATVFSRSFRITVEKIRFVVDHRIPYGCYRGSWWGFPQRGTSGGWAR